MQAFQVSEPQAENMSLKEADREWIRQEIQAVLKRRGVIGFIKDWGGAGAAIAILVLAFTQWTTYVEFRTHTNDRLDSIEKKLTTSELKSQATLPQADFDKALPDVRSALMAASRDNVKVSPAVVDGLRSKLLASSSSVPDFWPTVSEFISYKSLVALTPPSKPARPKPIFVDRLEKIHDCVDSFPEPMKITQVLSPHEAVTSRGIYRNCRFVLDSEAQDDTLNAILKNKIPQITFQDCLIEYHGGEIKLILAWDKVPFTMRIVGTGPQDPDKFLGLTLSGPAIQFENCLFLFAFQNPPPEKGQRLSTILLAGNTASVSLPVASP